MGKASQPTPQPGSERRKSERTELREPQPATLRPLDASEPPIMVNLVDVSEGGCRLRTAHSIRLPKCGVLLGTLEFRLDMEDPGAPPAALPRGGRSSIPDDAFQFGLMVRHLHERDGSWVIGAEFSEVPEEFRERFQAALAALEARSPSD